jgi:hypothetical protein
MKRISRILGCLALLIPATAFAADIHTVFKSWTSWFGRERTAQAESWIGADKEWYQTSAETRIVRKDLGLMWRMRRSGEKKYHEYPLGPAPAEPKPAPRPRGMPDPAADPADLRFVGHFDPPVYDWDVRALADETVRGETCKVVSIRGDADFSAIDIKLWIVPDGKDKRLAAPDELLAMSLGGRDPGAAEAVKKVLADHPKGGLVRMERTEDPQIGPQSRSRIELETYEVTKPPAGIYDLPDGYVKEEGK